MARRRRNRRRAPARATQQGILWVLGGIAVLAVLLVAGIVWLNRPEPVQVVVPEDLKPPPNADGKAWGPPDAPVVIQEYSDFQ